MSISNILGFVGVSRADRNRLQPVLSVRDKVTVSHDKPRTDATNLHILKWRKFGEMAKVEKIRRQTEHGKPLKIGKLEAKR